jgi:hypothetical protein
VQNRISEHKLVNPCHGWAIAADNHTGFHSYQLKARRSGFNGHEINNGQLRIGKTLPGTWQQVQFTPVACTVPDLNPIEHLWDNMEWAVCRMNVPPSNLQQLRDIIMWAWTNITVERFWHIVEFPKAFRLFWRQRALRPRYLINWPVCVYVNFEDAFIQSGLQSCMHTFYMWVAPGIKHTFTMLYKLSYSGKV